MKKLWNKIKRWWRKMFGLEVRDENGGKELELNSVNSFNKEVIKLPSKSVTTVTFGGDGFNGWLSATPSVTKYAGGMTSSTELGAGVKLTINGNTAKIENKSIAEITIINGVY